MSGLVSIAADPVPALRERLRVPPEGEAPQLRKEVLLFIITISSISSSSISMIISSISIMITVREEVAHSSLEFRCRWFGNCSLTSQALQRSVHGPFATGGSRTEASTQTLVTLVTLVTLGILGILGIASVVELE